MTVRVASTPLARKLARSAGVALSQVRGTGPGGRVVAEDLRLAGATHASTSPGAIVPGKGDARVAPARMGRSSENGPAAATPAHARRIPSTPYARRLARARGIDLGRVPGSGPGGRIVARDLDRSAVITIEVATEAATALCAHLNRARPKDAAPIVVADIVTHAVARAIRRDIAWTIDGIRPVWTVAGAVRLAAIAHARTTGDAREMPDAALLRAVASRGRFTLTIALPHSDGRSDTAALAAQIRDTIAWPIGLLL